MEKMVEFVFLILALSEQGESNGCQRQESDLLPMPYEDTALPMSYAGRTLKTGIIVLSIHGKGNALSL
jgi:hypothetical protein